MKNDKKFKEMTITGIASDTRNMQPVVILKEKSGERELYIWIGPVEAMALQRAMNKEVFQRPLTHELLRMYIDKTGVNIRTHRDRRSERSYVLCHDLFKESESKLVTVDARPSDSLVLATWMGVPIFVSEKVIEGMTRASRKMPRQKSDLHSGSIEQTDEELTKILERIES